MMVVPSAKAANLAFLDRRAHFAQRGEEPGAQRIGHDV